MTNISGTVRDARTGLVIRIVQNPFGRTAVFVDTSEYNQDGLYVYLDDEVVHDGYDTQS